MQLSTEKLIEKADILLKHKEDKKLLSMLLHLDFHLIAGLIDGIAHGKRKIFALLPPELQSEVALVIDKKSKERIFRALPDKTIARFLHFDDDDDATDILQFLPENRRRVILSYMKEEKRRRIEKLLAFGSETAGGLMDMNFIIVKPDFTLSDVAEKIKQHIALQKHPPIVLSAREDGKITGYIPYRELMFTSPKTKVSDLAKRIDLIPHNTDREKLLGMMSKLRTDVVCVVDEREQILGVVHLRDLIKVAQAEATEDIFRFAGVHTEEDVYDSVTSKVKRRSNWLIINLATAFLAAAVVGLFEGTIAQMAILAAYMPIVAGQGGNAATQALAVVVRGLAIGDIDWYQARKIIFREATAGTINGIITGFIAAGVAVMFHGTPMLGVVLAAAMIINLFVAGLFGALTPFVLKRFGIDPATASTIFVTTFTDVFGFFAFLGLGTLLLL